MMKISILFFNIFLLMIVITSCTVESATPNPVLVTPDRATSTPADHDAQTPSFDFLEEDAILVQLDYEPTFSLPRYTYDFGRVPVFTLLADGRLFFVDPGHPDGLPLTVNLSPEETAKFLQGVYDDGFSELESYEDQCQEQADGTQVCIADAEYSLLTIRMEDGSLKKIRNYAGFANQPEILAAIIDRLSHYSNQAAVPYIPKQAALFMTPLEGEIDSPLLDYPLSPPYSPPPLSPGETWALELQSRQIDDYLQATGGDTGTVYFMVENQIYQVEFVPWLPGNTFSAGMADAFPPTMIETSEQHWLSICPVTSETSPPEGFLRLVFIDDGNLFVQDEGSEALQINPGGSVSDFVLSPDHTLVFFINVNERGNEIWGADLFTGEPFPIAQEFPTGTQLELHPASDDNEWVAFAIKTSDQNGSLWAVRTNGEEMKEFADLEELKSLHPDLPEFGAAPYLVQWVPGTHLLVYDALPIGDGLFIHIPDNALVDVDTGAKQDYPPGLLDFSPDGNHVIARQTDHLLLARADGGEARRLILPYYALGLGESYFYPPVQWAEDSLGMLVLTPEKPEIPYEEFHEAPMLLSTIQLDNERVYPLTSLNGEPISFIFSPGGDYVAYWSAPFQSNERSLIISLVDGSEQALYDKKELIEFQGWSPDGRLFLYSYGEDPSYQRVMLGNPCTFGKPIFEGPYPKATWLDGFRFILELNGSESHTSQLLLATTSGETTSILELNWTDAPRWEAVLLP